MWQHWKWLKHMANNSGGPPFPPTYGIFNVFRGLFFECFPNFNWI